MMYKLLIAFKNIIFSSALDLNEDTMVIIIVVVSIIAVSIIGAIFYAKKND